VKLKERVAIVTGAASGIGKAIAEVFARAGAKVMAADINLDGVLSVVEGIKANGGVASAFKANVALQEDIDRLVEETVKEFGTVDILVNNAGIMDKMEPAGDITDEQWERIFAVNVTSVMRTTRKVLPIFLEKEKGNIINIASIGGITAKLAGTAYTASKFAVIGFTKSTGFMYAPKGIRCNAIAPGAVMTNIQSTMTNIHQFGAERTGPSMALNPRAGEPEEIAKVALFLASDESSFVNAAVLVADSGWTA
jgi:NAD(P)-dependent dehydrogenase (short-subunit alcohol dehydrogenase family)